MPKQAKALGRVKEFVSSELIPLENAMHSQSLSSTALESIVRRAERPQLNSCRLVLAQPDRLSHLSLVLLAEQLGRTDLDLVELVFGTEQYSNQISQRADSNGRGSGDGADGDRESCDYISMRTMGFALGTAQRLLSDCSELGKFNVLLCARKVSEIAADVLAARTLVISMARSFDEKAADPEQFATIRLFVGEALERCVDKALEIFSIARSLGAMTPPTRGYRSPIRGTDLSADSAVIAGRLFNLAGKAQTVSRTGARLQV